MTTQSKVTGVILAGGLARRMGQQDKGLVSFRQQPMVSYAIQAVSEVASQLLLNANRNIEQYQAFGYPVIKDLEDNFSGPLAGVYAAMLQSEHDVLLVVPCDSPFIHPTALRALVDARTAVDADIAVAFDGERIHPVFMALNCSLQDSLHSYLAEGGRKIDRWFEAHHWIKVDLSAYPECFSNINTLEDLTEWEPT